MIWENNRSVRPAPIQLSRTAVDYKDKAMNYWVQMLKKKVSLPAVWKQVPIRQRSLCEVAQYRQLNKHWADKPRLAEPQPVVFLDRPPRDLRIGTKHHLRQSR